MAGEDGGSSKQLSLVDGKGKKPLSPSSEAALVDESLREEVPEVDVPVVAGDDDGKDEGEGKGKQPLSPSSEAALLHVNQREAIPEVDPTVVAGDDEGNEEANPAINLEDHVRAGLAILSQPQAPGAHGNTEGTSGEQGKRAAEGLSGGPAAKIPRTGQAGTAKRGLVVGPYMPGGVLADPVAILSDPSFVADAAASGMDKGYKPLGPPPYLPYAAAGVVCSRCGVNPATTNVYSTTPHVCLCAPCVPLETANPTQARCHICSQESIDIYSNFKKL